MDLPSDDSAFETDLFKAVKQLVKRFELDKSSYRLIVNGGSAQEVDHLHFHLISDDYDSTNPERT
jgi:diadenosine tetraphosphate (Ap4A) HIT family hydrolase